MIQHNFYPRSPCGERHVNSRLHSLPVYFYPRSPCGERRIGLVFMWWGVRFLSTLSLRRATCQIDEKRGSKTFLSTLSLRRATDSRNGNLTSHCNFYPRSPCGERPAFLCSVALKGRISIHALLAESDAEISESRYRRTSISIHALLAESDFKPPIKPHRQEHFYPRSPCGERRRGAVPVILII